jgi:hypothetical protein
MSLNLISISRFALVPNTRYSHDIQRRVEAVQGKIPCRTMADHQFPQLTANAPPDARMRGENLHGLPDLAECRGCRSRRGCLQEEIHEALKIVERCG